jgi:hypothetical protein
VIEEDVRLRVLRNYASGAGDIAIHQTLGVPLPAITEILESINYERGRARQIAQDARRNGAAPDTPMPVAKPAPAVVQAAADPPMERLLADAEQLGGPLAQHAARVRGILGSIQHGLAKQTQIAAAEQRVEKARKDLDDATQALRALKGGTAIAKPVTPPTADWKAIRTWAVTEGLDCPAVGKVPGRVVDAYNAAHPAAVTA